MENFTRSALMVGAAVTLKVAGRPVVERWRLTMRGMRAGALIAIGVALGASIGAANHSLAMGVALGAAFGAAAAAFAGRR